MKQPPAVRHEKFYVPILYQIPAFGAFDDFNDFLESITSETSKTCQVRGSNPCRGAISFRASGSDSMGFVSQNGQLLP